MTDIERLTTATTGTLEGVFAAECDCDECREMAAWISGDSCAWCPEPYTVTVSFEDCPHATPACTAHFAEYFEYVGWEWLADSGEQQMCPDCAG